MFWIEKYKNFDLFIQKDIFKRGTLFFLADPLNKKTFFMKDSLENWCKISQRIFELKDVPNNIEVFSILKLNSLWSFKTSIFKFMDLDLQKVMNDWLLIERP